MQVAWVSLLPSTSMQGNNIELMFYYASPKLAKTSSVSFKDSI